MRACACALGKYGGASVLEAALPGVELSFALSVLACDLRPPVSYLPSVRHYREDVCCSPRPGGLHVHFIYRGPHLLLRRGRLPPQVHDWRTCESPRIPTRTATSRVSRTASKAHSVPRPGPPRSPALTTLFSRNRLSHPGRHSAPLSKTTHHCRSTSRKTISRRYRTTSCAYRCALPILRTSRPSSVSSDNTLPSCAS